MRTVPIPDHTAVRVALWRELHRRVDAAPPVLDDTLALALADPPEGWEARGDMHPQRMARARATVVARSRFLEDRLSASPAACPWVLLGAGLDSAALRLPAAADRPIFELDGAATQAWKLHRLRELELEPPTGLRMVAVDANHAERWPQALCAAGFDRGQAALVAALGLSMYLEPKAVAELLREVAGWGAGSELLLTFQLPLELVEESERPGRAASERGAREAGTPFLSLFAPEEIVGLARNAGFAQVRHVSSTELERLYFAGRKDGLRPSSAEELIVATVGDNHGQ